jgi:putative transposase
MTAHPDGPWLTQRAGEMAVVLAAEGNHARYVLRDYDTKFTRDFDEIFRAAGVQVIKVGPAAPNLNAFAERWVLSIREECLNHFVVFGEDHFRHIVSSYVHFYNTQRPHQSKDNLPLTGASPPETADGLKEADIVCDEALGGLLKSYRRAG